MKCCKLVMIGVIVAVFSISASTVLAQGPTRVDAGVGVDFPSSPYVVYPKNEDIFDTTPLFRFTDFSEFGATKYRIDVWQGTDLTVAPLYTVKGTGNCDGTECTMQPGIALKKADINGNGVYTWRIRAKVAGEWPVLWSQTQFRVLSQGFTSTFDTDYKKWTPLWGDWGINSSGYLKVSGYGDNNYSIVEKHLFTYGYVYEAKMKRKVATDSGNRLFFNANPYPLVMNRWDSGYAFDYYNNGRWSLAKREGGIQTWLIPETSSEAIVPYGWNKVTIWVKPPNFYFWINGIYLGSFSDATFNEGFTGIGVYMNESDNPLLVDWATVEYSNTAPYPMP